jgi:signal transduction histidine kinase
MTIWAAAFYILILHEIDDETNDSLQNYKGIIIKQFLTDSTMRQSRPDIMTRYHIHEIQASEANLANDIFYDSSKYIDIEMEYEPIRVLRTNFMTSDAKYYELTIETSTLEKEDLIETIFISIIALYIVLVICILFVTRYVFGKSFKPLYTILDWLNKFRLDKPIKPLENETVVEEFDILNKAIMDASDRSTSLYGQQRQFLENVSHELQTPLAVSINKLELLSENPDCTEEQLSDIASIHRVLNGIVKTNKSLLLLSRIENKQFADTKNVSINEISDRSINEFNEIYEDKQIRLNFVQKGILRCTMNESLAGILIKNLLKNAYIHNRQNGEINITITDNSFTIENSSNYPELNREKLFNRFEKQTGNKKSTGLGLAIIKSIISIYDIRIHYQYNGKHQFILTFR